ncbi:MAG: alpha/beta hydrolase [Granulosicoccus sp.]|nr:alpha/beta hydrolase [Granulosicoccus sp.]
MIHSHRQYIHLCWRYARAVLLVLLLLLSSGCTSLFFFPMQPHVTVPSTLGYEYRDVFVRSADGTRLHGWLIRPVGPPVGTLYFLHGNAENVSTHFRSTLWLVDRGYEIFALDYRGYGLSQGKPDLPEVFDDIEAGAHWISHYLSFAGAQRRPLYLYGQSLGASLAITFAHRHALFSEQFDGLVTEAAFARFGTIARHVASRHWLTWSAQYPAQWLIGRRYDPIDAIPGLDGIPKLMIHSYDDEVIPYRFGRVLFDAAQDPRQWIATTGPHIRAAADPQVRQGMISFLKRYAHQENVPILSLSDNRKDP